jgi:hypothetical protein
MYNCVIIMSILTMKMEGNEKLDWRSRSVFRIFDHRQSSFMNSLGMRNYNALNALKLAIDRNWRNYVRYLPLKA